MPDDFPDRILPITLISLTSRPEAPVTEHDVKSLLRSQGFDLQLLEIRNLPRTSGPFRVQVKVRINRKGELGNRVAFYLGNYFRKRAEIELPTLVRKQETDQKPEQPKPPMFPLGDQIRDKRA
ncbi:MAG TPA: hypothetical protein VFX17_00690 [Patescibacteria group bacterium]|nr:hypothetical protein [Patescibacteria group bacterium]